MRYLPRIAFLGFVLPAILGAQKCSSTPAEADSVAPRAEGTALSEANPKLTWSAGPFVVPNVTPQTGDPPVCPEYTATCSEYFFEIAFTEPVNVDDDQVRISIAWELAEADFDPYLYACDATGTDCDELLVNGGGSANPETMFVPPRDGSYNGKYRVVVAPFTPLGQSYAGTVEFQKFEAQVGVKAASTNAFEVFNPPEPFTGYPANEPTMGIDRNTNAVYMIYSENYLETRFSDATSPATALWADVTGDGAPVVQLDPFMADDEFPLADGSYWSRIWAVGFGLAASDIRFSDTPSAGTWTPAVTAAAGLPAGIDNESVASGPYPEGAAFDALRLASETAGAQGRAFYYCAHGAVNAFCIRSDNGGLTYNTGRPIFPTSLSCSNHGHVKVGADGTVYVPMNLACNGGQGVAVSLDAGETWTYLRITDAAGVPFDSTAGSGRWDANIAIANDGKTLYFAYQDADKDEPWIVKGTLEKVAGPVPGVLTPKINWEQPRNLGKALGLRNVTFPTAVAGDPDRAAFAFHGTTTEGDSGDPAFKGTWHLYVATTYDGARSWQVDNINPSDPTQKGGFCDRGINCPASPPYRNLLDFMDMVLDREGRIVVGHADGCVNTCTTEKGRATYADRGALARQAGGKPLFARNDALFEGKTADGFATAAPRVQAVAAHNTVRLSWKAPQDRGSPIEGYRVIRTLDGADTLLATLRGATVNAKPYFIDHTALPGLQYGYRVQALSALGEGKPSEPVFARIDRAGVASAPMPDATPASARPRAQARAESGESACFTPGITVVEDPNGDGINDVPSQPAEDIEWIAVAEPGSMPGKIVFTLKVASLATLLPQHRWVVYFTHPDLTEYYVAMTNAEDGTVGFEYGKSITVDAVAAAPVGQAEPLGALEEGSGYAADGTIVLVLDKAKVGGLDPDDPAAIDLVYAKTRATTPNPGAGNTGVTRDDTGNGYYDVVGNDACAKKAQTVAGFEAYGEDGQPLNRGAGYTAAAPVTLSFDASPTVFDTGVSAVKYVWNFGDGTAPVETASPRVTHAYTSGDANAYRVQLQVLDSTGSLSNTAKLTLLLGGSAKGNTGMLNESTPFLAGALDLGVLLGLLGLGWLGGALRRR